ncbi:uncharacterized protein VTP21DRAFT_10252 [Calcarisporiella thermophila]|uniref:uncharacterized protein n=1 Tax=Calcarisporiella thermophila TaxID=911321 RepID=UPI003743D8DB
MLQDLNSGFISPWQFIPIVNKTEWAKRSFSRSRDRIHSFIYKAIEKSLATYSSVTDKNKLPLVCILAEMPQYCGKEGRTALMHEMLLVLFAGHDTTSHTCSFAFGEIARRPEVQKNILAEVRGIFGDLVKVDPKEVLPEHLNKFNYTTAVMRETLRVYPAIVVFNAHVKDDLDICGKMIPADTDILCNVRGILMDPELFPSPEKFDPERWTTSVANSKANAYIEEKSSMVNQCIPEVAFNVGPHTCLGRNLATLELRCLIALLINAFHLELKESNGINPKVYFTMKPEGGIWINFKKRCSTM